MRPDPRGRPRRSSTRSPEVSRPSARRRTGPQRRWSRLSTWHERGERSAHPGDALREDRRRGPYRVSGRGRRTRRHGLRDGVGHERRGDVGRPRLRRVPRTPRVVLAVDPVRQARRRPLRSGAGGPAPGPRDAHGRRARRDGRRRIGAGRRLRRLRGRTDVDAVRRDLSGAHDRARPLRHGRGFHRAIARVQGGPGRVPRANGTDVGQSRVREGSRSRAGARRDTSPTTGWSRGSRRTCGNRPARAPPWPSSS